MTEQYDYDVALSFAGEDRPYVQQVSDILHAYGVKLFYDRNEEVDLWGKDLYTHLDDVYRRKASFCVMFISKYYKEKLWTNHERESAQARAFESGQEYILPARFDDTEIPGIRPTQGYIDLKAKTPAEVAKLIAQRVGVQPEIDEMVNELKNFYGEEYEIRVDGLNVRFDVEAEDYHNEFPVRLLLEMYRLDLLYELFVKPGIVVY
jgi:hypothetical protein